MKNKGEVITHERLKRSGIGTIIYARKHYWMKIEDYQMWVDLHTGYKTHEDEFKNLKVQIAKELHIWR
jgi:hypothetical protein